MANDTSCLVNSTFPPSHRRGTCVFCKRYKEREKTKRLKKKYNVKTLRAHFGLKPIQTKMIRCKKCRKSFKSQFIDDRKRQWFCDDCKRGPYVY